MDEPFGMPPCFERKRADLSLLAEAALDFIHARSGSKLPLTELARYLVVSEDAVLGAFQELIGAREQVEICITELPDPNYAPKGGTFIDLTEAEMA